MMTGKRESACRRTNCGLFGFSGDGGSGTTMIAVSGSVAWGISFMVLGSAAVDVKIVLGGKVQARMVRRGF